MADLVQQDMGHDLAEGILALAPEIQQRPAIEPDHVGQRASRLDRAALGQSLSLEQSKQVEFGPRSHLVERFVVGEVDDPDDETLAVATERRRKTRKGGLR